MISLRSDIERFIRTKEGDFNALALALFAFQFKNNRPYQAFCSAVGKTPDQVSQWEEIPAVPIRAFKSSVLTTFPSAQAAAIFQSSTTTGETPSRHYIKDLSFYESSLRSGFAQWMQQEDCEQKSPYLILTPAPAEAPYASLTWMMDVVKRRWGSLESSYFIQRGRVDEPRLVSKLKHLAGMSSPIVLAGTTLAFLTFFDYLERSKLTFQLPTGTRLMDTGGMKTQKYEITRASFVERATRLLGILSKDCVNEYGMCELSSQFYALGTNPIFQGPPWVRVQAIDTNTAETLRPGQQGLLRFFDLANVDSVFAIQTDDLGRLHAQGFELLGRAPGADLKGCSLSVEALLNL